MAKLIEAEFVGSQIVCENSDAARELFNSSRYGEKNLQGRIVLSLHDCLYLFDKEKIEVVSGTKKLSRDQLLKKAIRLDKNFPAKHVVYADFRNRGFIIKTALKFGADFRVYERGVKPGDDHAKWVIFVVREQDALTWHEFSAKNRVAHSTKKRLLIGCVDQEGDVTYWEVRWLRP